MPTAVPRRILVRVRILLAHDGSSEADVARSLLASVQWPAGTEVHLVGVIPALPPDVELPPDAFDALTAALERETRAQLDVVAASLRERGLRVEVVLPVGRPGSAIVDEAARAEASLIVLGSRGRGAVASALLGSVAAEVVDHATCPVLVARRPAVKRVVLAEDGSAAAAAAAQLLCESPLGAGVPVHVVNALPLGLLEGVDPGHPQAPTEPFRSAIDRLRASHRALAEASATRLAAAGLDAHYAVRIGDPATEIIAAAAEFGADLIALGTRGHTGLSRLFLGSVARSVLSRAPLSVLIVRGPVR